MSRYRHPDTAALVLAAGQGKRMNSDLAKVLHPMAGQPLLAHVLGTLSDLGVGRVLVEAVQARDYPVVMAATTISAVLVVLGNLLADLLQGVVDPRIGTRQP